ncbi:protein MIGRI [Deefgea rivuli]
MLFCYFGWRLILPAQRQELHRISQISAATLLSASLIALIWHFWR